jgi:hypothetical protein
MSEKSKKRKHSEIEKPSLTASFQEQEYETENNGTNEIQETFQTQEQPETTNSANKSQRKQSIEKAKNGNIFSLSLRCALFKSQRKTKALKNLNDIQIEATSVEEFKRKLLLETKQHLFGLAKREEDKLILDEKEITVEDIESFMDIKDLIGKRKYHIQDLSDKTLKTLEKKEKRGIVLRVYPFGRQVEDEEYQELFEGHCPRDRASAPTELTLDEIVARLKQKHTLWRAKHEMVWRIWANSITSKPQSLVDSSIENSAGPPSHLIHLFDVGAENEITGTLNQFN